MAVVGHSWKGNRKLKQSHFFLVTRVKGKCRLFPFKVPWLYRDNFFFVKKKMVQNHCARMQKVHLLLTCVAQECFFLSSLLLSLSGNRQGLVRASSSKEGLGGCR